MNAEHIEKIRPLIQTKVDALFGAMGSDKEQEIATAVVDDTMLGLFLIIATDFLASRPTAMVSDVEILDAEKGLVRFEVPMPNLFENYYQFRIQKMLDGNAPIHPGDTVTVTKEEQEAANGPVAE